VTEYLAARAEPSRLPEPRLSGNVPLERAFSERRSIRDFASGPITLEELSQLLWAAQGITNESGYRTAPSAGALYPLEIYIATGAVLGLRPGVHRYVPEAHSLVFVAEEDRRARLSAAALGQAWISSSAAIFALVALHARVTVKYGRRGVRYAYIEAGHAAQNVCLQATGLELGATVVGAFSDGAVRAVLGLAPDEEPVCLLPIGRPAPLERRQ